MAPPDVPEIVIPAVRHNLVKTIKLHNLKMLTEKHNDKKLAITLLIIWGGGGGRRGRQRGKEVVGFTCLLYLVENKWHYYSQSLVESLVLWLMQRRFAALTLHLVC